MTGTETAVAGATGTEAAAPDAPPVTRLVLARHAVTAQTGPLLSGRTPGIALSEEGHRQAAALGERLAGLPVVAVYASPIERTRQTAEVAAMMSRSPVGLPKAQLAATSGVRILPSRSPAGLKTCTPSPAVT